ncbi:MAG: RecX family transcriptional regulator [Eubacteriales bacterium]|nr:RecX family transcriptional regulator [Eubacteriales bacterium]MDD4421670.1 RecX family transcriptional regulator [Eubacteriales bacterium]
MYIIERILIDENNHEASVTCTGESFLITLKDIEALNIAEGDDIDEDTYQHLCEAVSRLACIKKAFEYLSYSDMSAKKLSDKLRSRFDKEIIMDVTELLKERGYLNDVSLAERYARSFYEFKHWGPIRIKSDLYSRGFKQEDIAEACSFLDQTDHRENIRHLVEKKYGTDGERLGMQKQKICAYLYRMGYLYEDICDTVNSMSDTDK